MPQVLAEIRNAREYQILIHDESLTIVRHLFEREQVRWELMFFGRPAIPHAVLP